MSSRLDRFFNLLRDGKWHSISEIVEKLELAEFKARLLVNALMSGNICVFSAKDGVRMKGEMVDFWKKMEEADE